MSLTGRVPEHPARYSPAVVSSLTKLLGHLRPGELVLDPFAGTGVRLGALCDQLGLRFRGGDIEAWPGSDPRVRLADATEASSYPLEPFVVATSPVYFGNRISSDYVNGPTVTTKRAGRHAYGISLGYRLHDRNLARYCRPAASVKHDELAAQAVRHWSRLAFVNVDAPIADRWCDILVAGGYEVRTVIPVATARLGGVANSGKRAGHEVVIGAAKVPDLPYNTQQQQESTT